MEAIRQIYERLPDTLTIPENLRRRRVEVILIALDDAPEARGWPPGFFDATYGSLPEFPKREMEEPNTASLSSCSNCLESQAE